MVMVIKKTKSDKTKHFFYEDIEYVIYGKN
jgi:hypothetical protein